MRFTILFAAGTLLAATAGTPYADDAAKWRAGYETSLKAPDGWLSVAGLFWLHEGDNLLGSDPQSDVVLPAGGPKRAGVLHLSGGKVTFQNRVLKSDATAHPDVVKIGDVSLTIVERGGKTGVRLRDPNAQTRREFTGCKWFPADASWRINAKWVAYPQPKKIAITNILGMTDQEASPGYAEFTIQGKAPSRVARTVRLEPVEEDGGLFFIFKDATSGKSTYGAGRFLDSVMPKAGVVELDFNKAYNPPCAFTAFATCPLPPKQNVMAAAIEAGEKSYGKH
ncbi:MAG: DUF1684 domain-containing protein [Bryobacteraceae bacterium]|jgi:uncharacterized protein (DUF1684 family)